jgi:outer membrane biosynthesis protein TonB
VGAKTTKYNKRGERMLGKKTPNKTEPKRKKKKTKKKKTHPNNQNKKKKPPKKQNKKKRKKNTKKKKKKKKKESCVKGRGIESVDLRVRCQKGYLKISEDR